MMNESQIMFSFKLLKVWNKKILSQNFISLQGFFSDQIPLFKDFFFQRPSRISQDFLKEFFQQTKKYYQNKVERVLFEILSFFQKV